MRHREALRLSVVFILNINDFAEGSAMPMQRRSGEKLPRQSMWPNRNK
jgi:hypothetical protein